LLYPPLAVSCTAQEFLTTDRASPCAFAKLVLPCWPRATKAPTVRSVLRTEQTAGDCQVVRYRGIRKPPGFVAFSTTSARGFAATEAFARPANQSPCVCAFRTRELIHLRSTPCRNSMGVSSNFPPVASPGLQPSRGLLANPSTTAEPNQYPPRNFPAIPLLALPTQSAMCS
jgi:hypothetical protein